MSLPEDLRQEYLETLGIVSYFPRFILPAAPHPQACEWPESWTQAQPAQKDAIPDYPDEGQSAASETARVINQDVQVSPPPAPPSPQVRLKPDSNRPATSVQSAEKETSSAQAEISTTPSSKRKVAVEDVRLQLLCIRVNDNLAVLNAMPHFGSGQLSRQHLALLHNMLQASGMDTQDLLIDEKPFHWPMVQGEHVDNSKSAAATALIAFLQQKLVDWQFRNLLVMGEQVVTGLFVAADEANSDSDNGDKQNLGPSLDSDTWASDSRKDSDHAASRPKIESQEWQTFYTRSLDEILQTPFLKKEIWSITRKIRH